MSAQLTAADVLERAAELIEPEGAWTQGAYARGVDGNAFETAWDDCVCFCAMGALFRAADLFGLESSTPARDLLFRTIDGKSVTSWNDTEGRTQAEVVAKLREAAALARAEAA